MDTSLLEYHLLISEPLIINNGLDQSHQMMFGIVHVKSSHDPDHLLTFSC